MLSAAGTIFADGENLHIYPMYQGHANPVDPSGDSFAIVLSGDFVSTYAHGFAGSTLAQATAQARGITEFGYPTLGGSPGGVNVDQPTAGKDTLNALMDAWNEGYKVLCIYTFYEDAPDGGAGFGLLTGPGNPKAAGLYLHNFTTPLNDTGANASTFSPGSLAYSFGGLPSTAKSLLFQKSNGNFELVIWNNVSNWNFSAGTPIAVSPTSVSVNFGAAHGTVNVYDPTSGTTPIANASGANAINVQLADYPIIVEVVN